VTLAISLQLLAGQDDAAKSKFVYRGLNPLQSD